MDGGNLLGDGSIAALPPGVDPAAFDHTDAVDTTGGLRHAAAQMHALTKKNALVLLRREPSPLPQPQPSPPPQPLASGTVSSVNSYGRLAGRKSTLAYVAVPAMAILGLWAMEIGYVSQPRLRFILCWIERRPGKVYLH